MSEAIAYIDGSFNSKTNVYGYGGYIDIDGDRHYIKGYGDFENMAKMRNVAGEILGCMSAVNKAIDLGASSLVVHYDYAGIEKWATGEWRRNKIETQRYHTFMKTAMKELPIIFNKVKGHSGNEGNDIADRLAKEAVGIF